MSYIGKWQFHSIGAVIDDEEGLVFLNAEEYLASPMPYIDETDEDEVASEMKERKQTVGSQIEVCEDGTCYMLMPLPENASKEEVDAAVAAGYIKLHNGMMTDDPFIWEEREGNLWLNMNKGSDEFIQVSDGSGYLTLVTTRYTKVD